MHWGIFVILAGAAAGTLAQAEDSSVDSARPNIKPCDDPNAERLECAPQPSCRPTCATPNPGPCILSCAVNECVCKTGFVLSEKGGKCVPVNQCPKDAPCNGDSNAVIKANPIPCPSTCSAPNASPWCKRYAPPVGCECKPGYLQAENGGKCIKPDECPGGNPCGVNGTFVWCAAGCPTNNCPVSDSRGIIACSPPNPCPNGCACKPNYKRKSITDDYYTCILASDCPPVKCTRQNEEWSSCPSDCLREDCADVDNQPTTCNTLLPTQCRPRCICKKGYFRNDTGLCVPAKQCRPPPTCPKGEVYNECGSSCPPSCQNKGNTCLVCTLQCVPGCYCAGKTIRAPNGTCVLPENCPPRTCTGQNEYFDVCPPTCPRTQNCSNIWSKIPCDPIDCCEPQCRCKSGFFKNELNKCVSGKECSQPIQCKANEVYRKCRIICPPQTCASIYTDYDCRNATRCEPGCDCLSGYLRNGTDKDPCIPSQLCPTPNNRPCDDPNAERLECAPQPSCRPTCATPNPGPCILSCAVNECVCKTGFVLSEKGGKCVPVNQCPTQPIQCKANEVYRKCRIICPPQTCASIYTDYDCRNATRCEPGCDCLSGYLRNGTDKDPCIPSQLCPTPNNRPCDDPNAERLECAPQPSCRPTCATPNPGPCILSCAVNECVCKTGFVLSEKGGKCVPVNQCPTQPIQCKANEVYRKCRIICPPQTCASIYTEYNCGNATRCEPGCDCLSGYLRNGTDKDPCIPSKLCPTPNPNLECGPNEVSTDCYNECQDETCKDRFTGPVKLCTQECGRTGCICQPGFRRHDNGTCVREFECAPASCPKGEVYRDCGSSCSPSCANKGNTCLVCPAVCVPGCYCAGKTIRAQNGSCVLPENCPAPKCTGPNEIFDKCPPTCPRTQNCSDLWPKIPCTPIDCCKPECRCKPGHYRNDKNICVSGKQCTNPAPECGPNEVSTDCYNDCQRTCKNRIVGSDRVCTLECGRTGCICKPDYLKHDNGTCVPEYECSPADCPKGEVFSNCGSSCPPSCENKGNTCLVCPAVCVPGCYCSGKTIRARNGTCVLPENCPAPKCGRNEVFDKCPPTCPRTENCSNLWSKEPCTEIDCCTPQCRCKPGFHRSATNACISAKECSGASASASAYAQA